MEVDCGDNIIDDSSNKQANTFVRFRETNTPDTETMRDSDQGSNRCIGKRKDHL